jgi:hypothetical protein
MLSARNSVAFLAAVLASLVAIAPGASASSGDNSANLLVNGDFESSIYGGCPGTCYTSCEFGTPGWTRGPSSIHTDLEQNLVSGQCGPYLPSGGQYRISVQGSVCCPCNNNGWIQQSVQLVPGSSYRIELDVLLDPFDILRVSCDSSQFDLAPGGDIQQDQWSHVVLEFVAATGNATLRIESIGESGLPGCLSASSAGVDNVVLAAVESPNGPRQWRVEDGGNGHWYALISEVDSWNSHRARALSLGGDLATLTSAEENNFVASQIANTDVWLGGVASLGSGCLLSSWKWASGEPWQYTNWAPGEPNNCNETRLVFAWTVPGKWNNHIESHPYAAIYEWSADCNNDGIVDFGQIAAGILSDADANGVPDCCETSDGCCLVEGRSHWTVSILHPAGASESGAFAAKGTLQAGSASVGGSKRASLWNGAADTWISLHPAGTAASELWATNGSQHVGWVQLGGAQRASLWNGNASSWTSLHPQGATSSVAYAISGADQGGFATVGGVTMASLWNGNALSWMNLHPSGASSSVVFGVHGSQQVGSATIDGVIRAGLWNGTAQSWVDLNPVGADYSRAWATTGTRQAGTATVGNLARASLWSGTAASWTDLSPAGSAGSRAYAMTDSQQVGYAIVGGITRASLWTGSAESWEDLHALLPPEFGSSYAYAISCDGARTYICGYGVNVETMREEALLWVRTAGRVCVSDINGDGVVGGADLGMLLSSWGPAATSNAADLDASGVVDGADLGRLMTDWGPCP